MSRCLALPRLAVVCLVALGASGAAQAALLDRGGGLIYDSDLNVTWLADANYAKTSGYDADGLMWIGEASSWASSLVYHDTIRNVDYTDWRLPGTTMPMDPFETCGITGSGYNCTDSEMGHLFYLEVGGSAGASINATHNANHSFFSNIQEGTYWSGTDFPNASLVWSFDMDSGRQHTADAVGDYVTFPTHYAWAVRDGDVAAVPEAETLALMLSGLGLIGWRLRRRGRFGYL